MEIGQTPGELEFELEVLRRMQPRTIVEIGTAGGGHIEAMSGVLTGYHEIIAVDTWQGKYAELYREFRDRIKRLGEEYPDISYSYFKGRSQELSLAERDTYDFWIRDNSIDYLFIDGSHEEEDVLKDWENWGQGCRLACFHDVVGYEGVARAFEKVPGYKNIINIPGVPMLKGAEEVKELGMGFVYGEFLESNIVCYVKRMFSKKCAGDL